MELGNEFYNSWSFVVLSNIEISKHSSFEPLEKVLRTINDQCLNVDTIIFIGDFIDK